MDTHEGDSDGDGAVGLSALLQLLSDDRACDGMIRRPVSEVCARLLRPRLAWPELPAGGWWLAGGAVLEWLLGAHWVAGDLDVFCHDLNAVRACLRSVEAQGGRLIGLSTWRGRACWRCGLLLGPTRWWAPFLSPDLAICQRCRRTRVASAPEARVAELLALTPESVASLGVMAVELRAPDARTVQVVIGPLHASPAAMFRSFDLSVCQIALDADAVYLSESARRDILERRVGVSHVNHPLLTLSRLVKYRRRGFRVRWSTTRSVFARARGVASA